MGERGGGGGSTQRLKASEAESEQKAAERMAFRTTVDCWPDQLQEELEDERVRVPCFCRHTKLTPSSDYRPAAILVTA